MNGSLLRIFGMISLLLGFGLYAHGQAAPLPDTASVDGTVSGKQDPACAFVRQFYTAYIGSWLADGGDPRAVLKQNLTRRFYERLQRMYEQEELDYDPFLDAQDCDASVLEKLRIEKDTLREHVYRVCLWDTYSRNYKHVELLLEHTGQSYRIDDVPTLPDKYRKMR